jgi:Predicted membrane protein
VKNIFLKYRQPIVYLINGGLTTAVNFVVYIVLKRIFGVHVLIANTIAWIVSVIYAFITNKKIVFQDNQGVLRQFIMFAGLRIVSYALEELSLFVFVLHLKFDDLLVKIIVSVLIVIINYIFSKFIIFKDTRF